ncbi:unnamed protein product [Owenia fusiformis]|uniref:Uncharacterized protein n=1 Tax=Owenia fusiformis TaxID=6347 RepID=A0A8S4N6J3_OWEFU|nr:unnamed protein product [Owenia fusiformis]
MNLDEFLKGLETSEETSKTKPEDDVIEKTKCSLESSDDGASFPLLVKKPVVEPEVGAVNGEVKNFKYWYELQKTHVAEKNTLPSKETIEKERIAIEYEETRRTNPHMGQYRKFLKYFKDDNRDEMKDLKPSQLRE